MAERLVFDYAVEGFFLRGLSGQVTPRLKNKLRQAGIDLDQKLLPAYPFETWLKCLELTAAELFPALPEKDSWWMLGELMVRGYQQTPMGSAMLTLLAALRPHQRLGRLQKSLRSGNNYTVTRTKAVSPTVAEVWVNDTSHVRYFVQGLIFAGMLLGRVTGLTVDILESDAEGTTYRIAWKEPQRG
ncbi:Myxococcales-restricted protein, TIGR02265 family [Stigmatella aurantiaca]|uniref:Myxococcales-restricted protein, TIGR02265 family n=1 Tax=Stigmatella aurantiaca TaxID=41 RepID=A0A1H7LKX4_STIAU|nr:MULTISPECIES: DUF2378 family protein [Stigmatella]SEK99027.1 Myxococcales-restricted protein, TIGR02265 family [Stigmatella aurantiaca]